MNDPLVEMLARQQQRELARKARKHRPTDDCRDEPSTGSADVRRPCRPQPLGIRLVALVTRG